MISQLLPVNTAVEELDRQSDVALLPIGSYEQHGSHLPLITDTIVACVVARALADAYGLLLLPPITISCSHERERMLSGSVSIRVQTLIGVINDIMAALESQGVHRLALVNGHGGNYILSNVVQEASVGASHRMLLYPTTPHGTPLVRTPAASRPAIRTCTAANSKPAYCSTLLRNWSALAGRKPTTGPTIGLYTSSGIIGAPSQASASKGVEILASLTESFQERLNFLREPQ